MEHLLSVWTEVVPQLRDAGHILLLTDYDGTLTPIVERPELANLSEETRQLLKNLTRQHLFTVGIISGRALLDLRNKVGISGIIYAGNHGMEIDGPGVNFINPLADEMKPFLRVMHQVLSRTLGKIKGVLIENKGLTLSVHYRMVEEDEVKNVKNLLTDAMGGVAASGRVKITDGKKVYEIRPAIAWDKGKAIKLLMKKYGKGGRESRLFPVFLGDDLTDEDGFRIIEKYESGISVLVGEAKQNSAARYFLSSTEEVTQFLNMLLQQAQRGFK